MKTLQKIKEKLKNMPQNKLIIVSILVILIVVTICVTLVALQSDPPVDFESDTEKSSDMIVFLPIESESESEVITETQTEAQSETESESETETEKPLDLSGVAGLEYASRGDGTCYITGIGTCRDSDLKIPEYSPSGDRVVKISDGAFANCTNLLAITIPSSVKTIGSGVFRGCANLVTINVDIDNTVYCSSNGVLMSKDKSVLVCYPTNKSGTSYVLHSSTRAIAAYAFEGAANLLTLKYPESIADFQRINILMGNEILDKIAITCNYSGAK